MSNVAKENCSKGAKGDSRIRHFVFYDKIICSESNSKITSRILI